MARSRLSRWPTATGWPAQANIVCFRVTPRGVDDLDALQVRIREELVHSGAFYIVKTRLRDRTYLRTTIINARTTEHDLSALLAAIRAAASRQPAD